MLSFYNNVENEILSIIVTECINKCHRINLLFKQLHKKSPLRPQNAGCKTHRSSYDERTDGKINLSLPADAAPTPRYESNEFTLSTLVRVHTPSIEGSEHSSIHIQRRHIDAQEYPKPPPVQRRHTETFRSQALIPTT